MLHIAAGAFERCKICFFDGFDAGSSKAVGMGIGVLVSTGQYAFARRQLDLVALRVLQVEMGELRSEQRTGNRLTAQAGPLRNVPQQAPQRVSEDGFRVCLRPKVDPVSLTGDKKAKFCLHRLRPSDAKGKAGPGAFIRSMSVFVRTFGRHLDKPGRSRMS